MKRLSAQFQVFLTIFFLCIYAEEVLASWPSDPNINLPVCTTSGNQSNPLIISDGANGSIIVWWNGKDGEWGGYDIYAQRLNSDGISMWRQNGIRVTTNGILKKYLRIVEDSYGGVIITWQDSRRGDSDIYAQRINAQGNPVWTANGVAVTNISGTQSWPELVSDGAGGAYLTWRDQRTAPSDSYIQWLNAAGNPKWKTNGVNVSGARNHQYYPQITVDGMGGVIVTWMDDRSHSAYYHWAIYAQRFNSSGNPMWHRDGVLVMGKNGEAYINPQIISDGLGGAIIKWHRNYSTENWVSPQEIYVQRLNSSGARLWNSEGIRVSIYGEAIYGDTEITPDGSGGAIVVWKDTGHHNVFPAIYAQRINQSGLIEWQSNGLRVGGYEIGRVTKIVNGEVIITWADYSLNEGLSGQKINMTGEKKWGDEGKLISNDGYYHNSSSDGVGGAVLTFEKGGDIYAKKVFANGLLRDINISPQLFLLLN